MKIWKSPIVITTESIHFMQLIAYCITILFGALFILVGILMFINPALVQQTIGKAGSTPLINYGELITRMIPAVALIITAKESLYPDILSLFGWFMLGTSLILMSVPRKIHYSFATHAATLLHAIILRVISPFAVAIGCFLIYAVW